METRKLVIAVLILLTKIFYATADESKISDQEEIKKAKQLGDEIIQDLVQKLPVINTTTFCFLIPKSSAQNIRNKLVQRYLMAHFSDIKRKVQPHIILLLGWYGYRDVFPFIIEQSLNRNNNHWCYSALLNLTSDDKYMWLRKGWLTEEAIQEIYDDSMKWWQENGLYLYRPEGGVYFRLNESAKKNKTPVDEITGEPLQKEK